MAISCELARVNGRPKPNWMPWKSIQNTAAALSKPLWSMVLSLCQMSSAEHFNRRKEERVKGPMNEAILEAIVKLWNQPRNQRHHPTQKEYEYHVNGDVTALKVIKSLQEDFSQDDLQNTISEFLKNQIQINSNDGRP